MSEIRCAIEGCDKQVRSRGWCTTHYRRWYRTGDPLLVLPPNARRVYERTPEAERFWAKVEKTDSCWLWTGSMNQGYGKFRTGDGPTMFAHRWSYEAEVAPIPEGLHLDHLCRTPACVRPEHLEPVTQAENNRRSVAARFGKGVAS